VTFPVGSFVEGLGSQRVKVRQWDVNLFNHLKPGRRGRKSRGKGKKPSTWNVIFIPGSYLGPERCSLVWVFAKEPEFN
jgi:hypothetical protein